MANLWISETYVNQTKGQRTYSETAPYESFTSDAGELYSHCQREYGRCTSAIYIDRKDGSRSRVGWVFSKRARYTDARGNGPDAFYLQETWITLHDAPDTVVRSSHLHDLDARGN